MKICSTYLILIICCISLFSQRRTEQQQIYHQWIVQNAYQYLVAKLGVEIPVLKAHLGLYEQGASYFSPGKKIAIGAYREDEEDIVYGYGWPNTTSTHFWNPDDGDGSHFCNCINQCFPNSYQKALHYIYGGWTFNYVATVWGLPNLQGVNCATQKVNLHLTYNSLTDMFNNERIYIKAVEFIGQGTVNYNPPKLLMNHNLVFQKVEIIIERCVWEILGRVAHLLADASTPCHALNDQHDGLFSPSDPYENNNIFQIYNYNDAILQAQQWGTIDILQPSQPIKYLFYTAANIAGHYPSYQVDGNNTLTDPMYFPHLQEVLNLLGPPPPRPDELDLVSWALLIPQIASNTFVYSIRTTAALFEWFANECNLIPPPPTVLPIISNITQTPLPIYKGNCGIVSCNLLQGNGALNYEWSLVPPNKPGVTVEYNYDEAYVYYNATEMIGTSTGEEYLLNRERYLPSEVNCCIRLRCVVSNDMGSDTKEFVVTFADEPPPGGCPFVYSWNGADWMEDNNILPQSQDSSILGQDVTDFYQLFSKPILEEDKYYLAVGEFENEKSYLDQFKLLVVDHPQETFITVTDEGQVIQFAKPANFASAELDSEDVYKLLCGLDGEQVAVDAGEEMALSFDGVSGSEEPWLLLIGQVAHATKEKLVGNILGENKESFTSFRLRRNPFYQWVQVPANDKSSLQVNILWKGEAEVDYTELSRRLELPFSLYTAELLNAEHNVLGDVRNQLLLMDEDRTELNPNEWITLEFAAPQVNEGMERSFVFVSRGRYENLPEAVVIEGKRNIPPIKKSTLSKVNTTSNEVKEYKLNQNYPNPFNPMTSIYYSVKEPGIVTLKLYDLLGREVSTLVNEYKFEGNYTLNFDGSGLSSGIYVCRMKVNEFSSLMKMRVLK